MTGGRFILVCQEDPTVLKSLLEIIEEERNVVVGRMSNENKRSDFCRQQGAVRELAHLGEHLKKLVRLKDGAATDKSRIGRIGPAISPSVRTSGN